MCWDCSGVLVLVGLSGVYIIFGSVTCFGTFVGFCVTRVWEGARDGFRDGCGVCSRHGVL